MSHISSLYLSRIHALPNPKLLTPHSVVNLMFLGSVHPHYPLPSRSTQLHQAAFTPEEQSSSKRTPPECLTPRLSGLPMAAKVPENPNLQL